MEVPQHDDYELGYIGLNQVVVVNHKVLPLPHQCNGDILKTHGTREREREEI